ncbi:hypothetical protein AZ034_003340, partial [Pluralibacter gergoviae]
RATPTCRRSMRRSGSWPPFSTRWRAWS